MQKFKILVAEDISAGAISYLEEKFDVEVKKGLSHEQLKEQIKDFHALIVRSATKVNSEIIENAPKLKVVGRAGIGVDNIDTKAATKYGIVVVNAPMSNTISAAEHTIALMMSIARKIPSACYSTKCGKWEKSKFKGMEIDGKTLGIVGFGKIGYIVAKKAIGLGMKVIAFDPFVSEDKYRQLGIKRAKGLEDIYREADIITIHLPKNKETLNMIDKQELYKMKKGAIIVNVARGGIIVEDDLYEAIKEGHISGAAIDVYETEPCQTSPLFELDDVVCTPHLGASTVEAQDKAGFVIAEQVSKVLEGEIANFAVNIPVFDKEAMEALEPFFELCENIGSLFSSMAQGNIEELEVGFSGKISVYDTRFLTSILLTKILDKYSEAKVNSVNAFMVAEENALKIKEVKSSKTQDYISLVSLKGKGKDFELSMSGTITGIKNKPRFVDVDKFEIDMVPSKHMAFLRYKDIPGQIGKIGSAFGKLGVNIAAMHVGRQKLSGDALMGLNLDSEVTDDMLKEFKKLSGFENIKIINLY